jgi:hypothetical protein
MSRLSLARRASPVIGTTDKAVPSDFVSGGNQMGGRSMDQRPSPEGAPFSPIWLRPGAAVGRTSCTRVQSGVGDPAGAQKMHRHSSCYCQSAPGQSRVPKFRSHPQVELLRRSAAVLPSALRLSHTSDLSFRAQLPFKLYNRLRCLEPQPPRRAICSW